jgi:hypothetical protein
VVFDVSIDGWRTDLDRVRVVRLTTWDMADDHLVYPAAALGGCGGVPVAVAVAVAVAIAIAIAIAVAVALGGCGTIAVAVAVAVAVGLAAPLTVSAVGADVRRERNQSHGHESGPDDHAEPFDLPALMHLPYLSFEL